VLQCQSTGYGLNLVVKSKKGGAGGVIIYVKRCNKQVTRC